MSISKPQEYRKLPGRQRAVCMAVILASLLSVTICGCESYTHQERMSPLPVGHGYGQTGRSNPNFVFDVPKVRGGNNNVSSEGFLRNPWPVSPEASRPVTTYDISSYDENFYSDQYISSSGTPYQHVHKRTYGRRTQESYR